MSAEKVFRGVPIARIQEITARYGLQIETAERIVLQPLAFDSDVSEQDLVAIAIFRGAAILRSATLAAHMNFDEVLAEVRACQSDLQL